jgi:peptidylprolyl isomerase
MMKPSTLSDARLFLVICTAFLAGQAVPRLANAQPQVIDPTTTSPAEPVQPPDPVPTPTEGMPVITTESGLKYVDIKVGDGAQPPEGGTVKVHYSGWLDDGTLFDSSVKRGQPTSFGLNNVIKGWTEGVGSMKVGGKRKLIVPPELGYGSTDRPGIPANSTLTFEVELLEAPQPPKMTSITGLTEQRSELVIKYWDIVVGTGDTPTAESTIKMHYSLWLEDETLLDSSLTRGEPVTVVTSRLFPGWSEGLLTMKAGGKRRLVLPPTLALGRAPRPARQGRPDLPANSTVIVEVELIEVQSPPAAPGTGEQPKPPAEGTTPQQ